MMFAANLVIKMNFRPGFSSYEPFRMGLGFSVPWPFNGAEGKVASQEVNSIANDYSSDIGLLEEIIL